MLIILYLMAVTDGTRTNVTHLLGGDSVKMILVRTFLEDSSSKDAMISMR